MSLILTPEQHSVLANAGNPYAIPVIDSVSNAEYVLVPQEVYRRLVRYDDSPFDISEAYPLMDEAASQAGWCDPEMDVYDKLYPRNDPDDAKIVKERER